MAHLRSFVGCVCMVRSRIFGQQLPFCRHMVSRCPRHGHVHNSVAVHRRKGPGARDVLRAGPHSPTCSPAIVTVADLAPHLLTRLSQEGTGTRENRLGRTRHWRGSYSVYQTNSPSISNGPRFHASIKGPYVWAAESLK